MTTLDAARQARFRQRRKERLALAEEMANALEWMLLNPRMPEAKMMAQKVLAEWRGQEPPEHPVLRRQK